MFTQQKTQIQTYVTLPSLVESLEGFRVQLEHEAECPLEGLKVNAALLVFDLLTYLEFPTAEIQSILGKSATEYIDQILSR